MNHPVIPPVDQQLANKTLLYTGLPRPEHKLDQRRRDGYKTIYFLTPEEVKEFACPFGDNALVWESDEQIKNFFLENLTTMKLLGAEIADTGTTAQRLAAILGETVQLFNFDIHSAEVLEKKKEPLRNAMRNFRWVEDGVPLRRLKGMGKNFGTSAIIIAAGPSLDAQWAELRRIRQNRELKTTFIVVGRAYRKAVFEGVMPEFVVEAEQFEWDSGIWAFAPQPDPGTILACPITTCPGVFKGWPGEKVALLDHTTAQIHEMEVGTDSIDAGNSIAHVAFNLAAHLGCNPIGLAGVDLGYPDPQNGTHADGTFHEAWPQQILRAEHARQEIAWGEGNDGQPLQTSPSYQNFGSLFETLTFKHRKSCPQLKVYSLSPRGLPMRGIEYLPIKEWGQWIAPLTPSGSSSQPPASSAGSLSDAGSIST